MYDFRCTNYDFKRLVFRLLRIELYIFLIVMFTAYLSAIVC